MKRLFVVALALSLVGNMFSQSLSQRYLDYIAKYKSLAVTEQYRHGIPASITMAQALLESNAGQSMLAVKGKNHFGIKCGSDWKGKTIHKDDDNVQDCFRSYKNVLDSYEDHSLFLKRDRYASLYSIPMKDYKAWARELKRCGYATDPNYANKLIKVIEDYNLADLIYETADGSVADVKDNKKETKKDKETKTSKSTTTRGNYVDFSDLMVQTTNNKKSCYRLKRDATITEVAEALGKKNVKTLLYYNDMFEDSQLPAGTLVYTSKKRSKGDRRYRSHTVKAGESMHLISQEYGITLKALYRINGLNYGTVAKEEMVLFLQ